ncbi:uncharacterized protein C2845_PM02G16770 [Panicum miliaceum]|uniref:Uncharacterized protein n=1 Tax=Panicum miliaceum TaxID=4540 RepID=A0A3L6SI35_PANMI|nr:uncharacterized protein C2845_PM02G16770 [Panicum miliaceum]
MRNKIASDEKLKVTTLVDFSIFCAFDGHDLLTTFSDDKDGDSSILDFTVHCLRYDNIVHKEDSIGYKANDVEKVYMDAGKTETEEFTILRQCLESEIEQYSNITKAKRLCINLIYNRIVILDMIDYFWVNTSPEPCHQPIYAMLPIINVAFQKVTKNKFPQFDNWSRPFIDVPKQAGPSDFMFFLWKYMEFWDGESLNIDINPFKGMIYNIEMMHYLVFHPLNQGDIPDELDIYRLGGRKIEWNESQ